MSDPGQPTEAPSAGSGVRSLAADEFSLTDSVGGPRGVVETMAPGLVFVVVFVATHELMPPLVASLAVAVAAVVARLVQRTPVTQAFGGLLGVVIGVVWAWRSGDATQYFAYGLWTNGAYLVVMLASVLVSWPLVGVVVEALRAGFGAPQTSPAASTTADAGQQPPAGGAATTVPGTVGRGEVTGASPDGAAPDVTEPTEAAGPVFSTAWRKDPVMMRRYQLATWLWIGMFTARLAVQVPLYLSSSVGWLGTARLVMGIPLWGLVLWGTWILVRRPSAPAAR